VEVQEEEEEEDWEGSNWLPLHQLLLVVDRRERYMFVLTISVHLERDCSLVVRCEREKAK